jgi:hypothetical protein
VVRDEQLTQAALEMASDQMDSVEICHSGNLQWVPFADLLWDWMAHFEQGLGDATSPSRRGCNGSRDPVHSLRLSERTPS